MGFDSVVERSILEALPPIVQDKTLLVVARRLPTIQDSECILPLNESRLVVVGTHQSLRASSELCRTLVANQQMLSRVTSSSAEEG